MQDPVVARRHVPEDARRSIARELSNYYAELSDAAERDAPQFSLSRVIEQMQGERGLHDGYEREVCASAALLAGEHFDQHRVTIPLTALRAMAVSPSSAGGYLASILSAEPIDILRPWSVVASAGVTTLTGLRDNLQLPRVTAVADAGWLTDENTAMPAAQPTVGAVALTPHNAAGFINFSHQFQRQAPTTEPFLRQQLLAAVGALLDKAFFAGSGTGGEPHGLLLRSGIGTQAGASLAHTGLLTMRGQVIAAGGREANLSWVAPPAVQTLLGARDRISSGGRFLWDNDGILGRPAYATANAPATTLILGDFSQAVIGLWGAGLKLEINPFSVFKSGMLTARVILTCDCVFPVAGAFSVATSVT